MFFSKIIKKKFDAVLGRYDGDPALYYFSPADFPEILTEPYDIQGDRQVTLKGAFYYEGAVNPDALVVFDHGIGAGHLAYFKEIVTLVQAGYTVYSYDHTGCVSTGGTGILGFAQGVNDLDHVLTALQEDERFRGKSVRLMGHSWGGYSAMNAAALHPEVTHVVSLAGFVSARALIEQYLPKFVLKYADEVMDRERQNNPKYADMNACDSLKKTDAKFFHIQSEDDQMVLFSLAYEPLKQALEGRENTVFVQVSGRNHDPHYTDAAARLVAAMKADLAKKNKKHLLDTEDRREAFKKAYDWNAMTQQDPEIWRQILDFLK